MSEDASKLVPSVSDSAKDYLKEEQKQRRQEIENLITRTESDQRNGLIFTGAIWAWLATNVDKLGRHFDKIIVILPALIMGFFFYRWRVIDKTILTIAAYVRKLEELFGVPAGYGWEGWLLKRRTEGAKIDPLAKTSRAFRIGLIIANIALAVSFVLLKPLTGPTRQSTVPASRKRK